MRAPPPDPMPDLRLERTVSASTEEFRRGLEAAFPVSVVEPSTVWHARHGPVTLTLRCRTLPPLRIALLSMPQLAVTLEFAGGTPAEQHAMLDRLDRYTHRGGG